MEIIESVISFCVMIAGFINAGAIAKQAWTLKQAADTSSHDPVMYYVFLFIQLSLVGNAWIHSDWWQASGMIASMATTIWALTLIHKKRKEN